MKIRNLIFDMGNVLLRYDPELPLAEYCRSEEERDVIRKELFESEIWLQADDGAIAEEEKFDRVKPQVPKPFHAALKNCCDHWFDFMQPLPGAIAFCEEAKARGYRLFVLSNASNAFDWFFAKRLPMELFAGCVVSAKLRLSKPDHRIYEYLLKQYDLRAEECFFFDDNAANTVAAREVGISALQFQGDFTALRQLLGWRERE